MVFVLKYFAPLLALIIASSQFIIWRNTPYSTWKGGGFGMYTNPHPSSRSVWIVSTHKNNRARTRIFPPDDTTTDLVKNLTAQQLLQYESTQKLIREFITIPTKKRENKVITNLESLFKEMSLNKETKLLILEHSIELKSKTWKSTLIYGDTEKH